MLNLKKVLDKNGIKHSAVANAAGLSKTSLSHLISENKWPKKTNPDTLKQRVEDYLAALNITLACDIWAFITDLDSSNEDKDMQKMMISQAAKKLFGIFRDPFNDDVNCHEDVFLSSDQRYIRESMYVAAKHGGFLAVIGESGAGKSVLRRDLIDRINKEGQPIRIISPATPDKGRLTASGIEDAVIYDLNPEVHIKRSHEAKARQMQKLLMDSSRAGSSHCLIIEEAHDLTIPVLKQLKRFWEMEDGFKKLLSIILIGQPELKSKLDERMNYEAREVIRRIEIAELLPLDGHLPEYLAHKFNRVGLDASKIFDEGALTAIKIRLTHVTRNKITISNSYPLVVNNLTVRILNHAAEIGAAEITADIVESA